MAGYDFTPQEQSAIDALYGRYREFSPVDDWPKESIEHSIRSEIQNGRGFMSAFLHTAARCPVSGDEAPLELAINDLRFKIEAKKIAMKKAFEANLEKPKTMLTPDWKPSLAPRTPCHKVLGHGESCVEGYLCNQCEWIRSHK